MPDNFRHAQYDTAGVQIDDPQVLSRLSTLQAQATQALVSEDRITTWANRAALVTAGLTSAFFTDVGVGGSYWDYVGGRWRPSARRVMLANLVSDQATQATSLGVMYAVALPPGLVQDGDILEWDSYTTKTGGTAETATVDWRIGSSAASVGIALGAQVTSLATNQTQMRTQGRLRRLSATSVRRLSAITASGASNSAGAASSAYTVSDMDTTTTHFQVLGNVSVGAETLTLVGSALYLEAGA